MYRNVTPSETIFFQPRKMDEWDGVIDVMFLCKKSLTPLLLCGEKMIFLHVTWICEDGLIANQRVGRLEDIVSCGK